MYVLRKRYKDFKSSQIAMNKSLELERSTSGASIHTNISSASGYKVDIRNKNSDRKSTRLNSSHSGESRMPSSA